VAVVRISGRSASAALEALSGRGIGKVREAELRTLRDPESSETLDKSLVLGFRAPQSFTGEDVVELHLHGGLAVVDSVLDGLGKIEDLRLAEPGEFSRRGVENGKFDLSAAEGIADLIEAETSAQRRQALRQMGGAFGALCDQWRERLVKSLAYVEAEIDFADEDLPDDLSQSVMPGLTEIADEISEFLADRRGEKIRDGIFVAVVGPPNAGKSSLVNALAGRDAVIVSEEAGTTRDVVEVRLVISGVPVTICDTAGLREGAGAIEREGIRRAKRTAAEADLRIWMADASDIDEGKKEDGNVEDIYVLNKIDLDGSLSPQEAEFGVSVKTGAGMDDLSGALQSKIAGLVSETEAPVITRARHRKELAACLDALGRAAVLAGSGGEIALVAEELRQSTRALGRITGRVDVEELLDVVFRDFCIGK
jgi:tRNA modification GTPase